MNPDLAKMKQFLALARVLRQNRDRDYTPPTVAEEAMDEIDDFVTMLTANFGDGDSMAAKMENTAGLLHATLALADLLLCDVEPEDLLAWIEANRESEAAA